ncbi:hypothetical protein [Luteibacter sp. CQ10]|uniref:hypothetical protein n=1 Tax=Luteibacter sp. CQ10 TaxID=2805821 RepID=UPI0034A2910C
MEITQKATGAHKGIIRAYREHQDLLIFALTGRTGSGCTTAADLLTKDFDSQLSEHFQPSAVEARKRDIVVDFAKANWQPFSKITVSSIIVSLLAKQVSQEELNGNLHLLGLTYEARQTLISFQADHADFLALLEIAAPEFDSKVRSHHEMAAKVIKQALPALLTDFKRTMGENYSSLMQTVGDNLRASGNACVGDEDPEKLFHLPLAIVRAIECIRENDKSNSVPTRIVIDAIRNPLELIYLRDRYSTLYAIAITTDEDDRKDRLHALGLKSTTIEELDAREYPKKHKPLSTYHTLTTQDIQSCLQKADIFISNTGKYTSSKSSHRASNAHLYGQLLRYYALALHPGLVTPTRDERCMQIALVAKLNSGCISRQVGAAVTDSNYVVRAIGWNDVPRGQVPCALRNVDGLDTAKDEEAYSEYERSNDELRAQVLSEHANRNVALKKVGLPCPYCFKDAANSSVFADRENRTKGSNQVHTRSLHAEENAFLQLTSSGTSGINGGRLYTTASPCELCSKKAYQLGIADIIYIDPYPGISIPHIMIAGSPSSRPKLRLFHGAVGKAYHRLYDSMLPIKDEIRARLQAGNSQLTA